MKKMCRLRSYHLSVCIVMKEGCQVLCREYYGQEEGKKERPKRSKKGRKGGGEESYEIPRNVFDRSYTKNEVLQI